MRLGRELIAGERVADQNGVAAFFVQAAIGLVSDGDGLEVDAAVQADRSGKAKAMPREIDVVGGGHRPGRRGPSLRRDHRPSIRFAIALGGFCAARFLIGHL